MERRKTFYFEEKNLKTIDVCGSEFIYFTGGYYEIPFAIKPTKGEHSLSSCDGCSTYHKSLVKAIKKRFKEFPECCSSHKKLFEFDKFNIEDFKNFPKITADKVLFTFHHIINNLDSENWFTDITDYIEYAIESYGSFPPNYGQPFDLSNFIICVNSQLEHYKLNTLSGSEKKKINRRITVIRKHLNSYFEKEPVVKTDLNLLLATYNKWYKIFPFDLEYFKGLKEKFGKTIPIIDGKPQLNKYTGSLKMKLVTKDTLTQYLMKITKDIIINVNGAKLYDQGLLTNTENIQLDLILHNRKLELNELSEINNEDKKGYIKILKKWFKSEKQFIKDISPYIKNVKRSRGGLNSKPNRTDIAYYCYYTANTKTLEINNTFPSDKAWTEIGKKFKKNAKNIQQAYNLIMSDKEERLKKSRIKTIKYVIENMLHNDIKAKKLAEDELKIAELKS